MRAPLVGVLAWAALCVWSGSAQNRDLHSDAAALCALQAAVENKAALASWDCADGNGQTASLNPCAGQAAWLGVTCDSALSGGERVTRLSLGYLALGAKQLPSSIGQLDALTHLNLGYNSFLGTIPPSVGQLVNLRYLDFISNQLSGTIPATEIGKLTNLIYLDFGTNRFKTEIDISALCYLPKLEMFNIAKAQLFGTLPECIGNWRSMTVFSWWINSFTGTIPSTFGLLTNMSSLFLDNNRFTGTLPSELARLTKLRALNVYENRLSGTIPNFSSMRNLYRLSVQSNYNLQGPALPNWLTTITTLKTLEVNDNSWSPSSIPSGIGRLSLLALLRISDSRLTGKIPLEICQATSLLLLNITQNQLTGAIPSCLGEMTMLQYLKLRSNSLSRSIPPSFTNLSSLAVFDASFNQLSGPLPSGLGNLKNLALLQVSNNRLTSTLPLGLGTMPKLQFLYLNDNLLVGSIPASLFCSLGSLIELSLARNALTSSLSSCIGALTSVQSIDLSFNRLSSSLPAMAGLRACKSLKLSHNSLTSSVPTSLGRHTPALEMLQLDHNLFSSTISFLDASVQTKLASLDVSSNAFTGPIGGDGDEVFKLPALKSFAASSNCFQGSLPSSLCGAVKLESLVLNGLTSGTGCKQSIWPQPNLFSFTGSYASKAVEGVLPHCLFRSLQNITALHLLGNGLRGSTPDDGQGWPLKLQELTLSQNRLSGSLSAALQEDFSRLKSVDISFNEITGVLDNVQLPDGSFKAGVNRLSGTLSPSIVSPPSSLTTLSVLDSNLFDCSSPAAGLPASDPDLSRFQCGSMALNKYLYALLSFILGSGLLVAAMVALKGRQLRAAGAAAATDKEDDQQSTKGTGNLPILVDFIHDLVLRALDRLPPWDWRSHVVGNNNNSSICSISSLDDDDSAAFALLARILVRTRMLCSALVLLALAFLTPLFALLTATSSTHTFSYAWAVSAALKTGNCAAAALLVAWPLFLITYRLLIKTLFYSCRLKKRRRESLRPSEVGNMGMGMDMSEWAMSARLVARLAVITLVNVVAVMAGNVIFVQYNTTGTVSQQVAVKLSFSVYKFVWNTTILPWMIKTPLLFFGVPRGVIEVSGGWLRGGELFVLGLLSFNNIVAPCLATAATDPRCFSAAFYAPQPVEAKYTVSGRAVSSIIFKDYKTKSSGLYMPNTSLPIVLTEEQVVTQTSSFSAPFIYRYACSSSLLQSYVPVFVLMGVLSIFGTPCKYVFVRVSSLSCLGPGCLLLLPPLPSRHRRRQSLYRCTSCTGRC